MEVWSAGGRQLFSEDYECLHATQAEWTPDSQFLVFKGYNSGGHQPYHEPIVCYSRARNGTIDLQESLGAGGFGDGPFILLEPDTLLAWAVDMGTGTAGAAYPLQVQLSSLLRPSLVTALDGAMMADEARESGYRSRREAARLLVSPDGAVTAVLLNLYRQVEEGVCLADYRLEVRNLEGQLLLRRDLPDFVLQRAAWTSDSQHLVISSHESGIPEPYHYPTLCYSRPRNSVMDLGVALGVQLFATGDFRLEEPDGIVTFELFDRGDNPPDTHRVRGVKANLNALSLEDSPK